MVPHPVCMPSPCGRAGAAVHAGSAYRRMAMVRGTHERELMIVRLAQSREYRFAEWAGIKVQSWDADYADLSGSGRIVPCALNLPSTTPKTFFWCCARRVLSRSCDPAVSAQIRANPRPNFEP